MMAGTTTDPAQAGASGQPRPTSRGSGVAAGDVFGRRRRSRGFRAIGGFSGLGGLGFTAAHGGFQALLGPGPATMAAIEFDVEDVPLRLRNRHFLPEQPQGVAQEAQSTFHFGLGLGGSHFPPSAGRRGGLIGVLSPEWVGRVR